MIKKLKETLLKKFHEADSDMGLDPRSEEVYAVTALYDTPNEILLAADKVAKSDYKKFDVNTPYPVHGLDDAMRLKPTKVGYFSFLFGFIGTCSALLMIGWMSGIDYRSIVGGKPFFSIPPSIPITFELTVLLSGLTTVGVMLFLFNKLPWNNNPLMDTNYMKRVSSDKFGVVIKSDDPKFNKEEVIEFLKSTGGNTIEVVNKFIRREGNTKAPIFETKFIGGLVAIAVVVAGGTYVTLNYVTFLPPFDFMWAQEKVTPQQPSEFFSDGYSVRTPPEGTVMRGYIPYEYKGLPDSMVKYLSNPIALTQENLADGKKQYDTYCSPCHGYFGEGDSRLRGQFPNPPTIHSEKVRNWVDGNIYHVITNGQNVMPSYASQVSREDRWKIIHYIRALQRAKNATDDDIGVTDTTQTNEATGNVTDTTNTGDTTQQQ
ncbi:MAG TPA: quinol:electron acceptor oxidoreductase subunit ActD [Ignavibacteria bacterium]|nr:quinol:electron acceptor oxidoreductase subunit ActD [Ignavibacteria bacterium]